jgi:ribosomal protein L7Ae-like RNA K-turn-binding protein
MDEGINKNLLNMLGLARRAGLLLIGQDQVLASRKSHESMVVVVTNDCSANVRRALQSWEDKGEVTVIVLKNTDRATLGAYLGVGSTQIAALPRGGLAEKVLSLYDRSDADEQN